MNAIEVNSLTKYYGETPVVNKLSFSVKKGSVHGFLGPNGAGKTTTMRMVCGLLSPDSGDILVLGENPNSNLKNVASKIGFLLELAPLYYEMTVLDYLLYVGRIRNLTKNDALIAAKNSMTKLGLADIEKRIIGNLSRGLKQRVGVAQAILHNPELIVLDEPTLGLDPQTLIDMRTLISDLKKDHTILLSSHVLHEISLICDEITIIHHGVAMASGSQESMLKVLGDKQVINLLLDVSILAKKDVLTTLAYVSNAIFHSEGNYVRVELYTEALSEVRDLVVQHLLKHNVKVYEIYKNPFDLEKIFLNVTKEVHG